ncbi:Phosphatidate cytidylyltransferase [Defluviimonas aquaemixtae]|uniref:Phosphatidate cytidylyltransferase n=1 Tax=Albidovulum aquaemixtae TaxID=1542388 RepID=A0A2R8B641_9RHOB|nr:phosphatidate cytidylyltransferase [Defluviimonas aquaemixtae]SPH17980.1 Phosphatidate cytidylyltransferase [Defluviimonas aquaemixtae]
MSAPGKWGDLAPRVLSGLGMAVGGLLLVWLGGPWFAALAIVAAGIMVWELAAMTHPRRPAEALLLGLLAAFTLTLVLAARADPKLLVLLALPTLAGVVRPRRPMKLEYGLYSLAIMVASYGLVAFREGYGMLWLLWLILVVVVTDVAGYFAGRIFGGPKFWPRISPKKTWSGTAAGWVAAAAVGIIFLGVSTAGIDLLWISALLAFSSQMGDIAESAIKRRAGVKDSSNLIPGHGGLMDRFDGLLGAALFMLFVAQLTDVPVVRF